MDNKTKHDGRDSAKVDAKDPSEVEYVHSQFPQYSHEEIKQAIDKAGPVRQDIYDHLGKQPKK